VTTVPSPDDNGSVDVDEVVEGDVVAAALARVRARLDGLRRAGRLPDFPADELDRQFLGVVESVEAGLAEAPPIDVAAVRDTAQFAAERIELGSSIPGGAVVHRAVSIVGRRLASGILSQVGDFSRATAIAVTQLAERQRQVQDVLLHVQLDRIRALEYRVAELELELTRLRAEAVPHVPAD
jgi:hypothetical protein